jgi:hypothetical protein
MQNDWVKIYSTPLVFKAELIKSMLLENEIEAVVMNKQSSSLLVYGEAEVYVMKENAVAALHLIDNAVPDLEQEGLSSN